VRPSAVAPRPTRRAAQRCRHRITWIPQGNHNDSSSAGRQRAGFVAATGRDLMAGARTLCLRRVQVSQTAAMDATRDCPLRPLYVGFVVGLVGIDMRRYRGSAGAGGIERLSGAAVLVLAERNRAERRRRRGDVAGHHPVAPRAWYRGRCARGSASCPSGHCRGTSGSARRTRCCRCPCTGTS